MPEVESQQRAVDTTPFNGSSQEYLINAIKHPGYAIARRRFRERHLRMRPVRSADFAAGHLSNTAASRYAEFRTSRVAGARHALVGKPAYVELKPEIFAKDGTPEEAAESMKYSAAMRYAYFPEDRFLNTDALAQSSKSEVSALAKSVADLKREAKKLRFLSWKKRKIKKEIASKQRQIRACKELSNFCEKSKLAGKFTWSFRRFNRLEANPITEHFMQRTLLGTYLRSSMVAEPPQPVWNQEESTFVHDKTGNRIALLLDDSNEDEPTLIMAFNGTTGAPHKPSNWRKLTPVDKRRVKDAAVNYGGGEPDSVEQAIRFGQLVRMAVHDYNKNRGGKPRLRFVSTGHSRGGMLAAADVAANGGLLIGGNSEGLGAGVRRRTGLYYSHKKPADTAMKQLYVKGDSVSNSRPANVLAMLWEKVTLWRAPRNFGEGRAFKKPDYAAGKHSMRDFMLALSHSAQDAVNHVERSKDEDAPNP